ncbi:VIT domain-containing protein [Rugamonas rubra]|uniref:Tetratricopeptide repeat-containing protein n=1 Tax=Rugamonas rubra TaxID=758825 RepID=A0A1I4NPZ4_9BURK|nr:VIT domain-containing protein [Rugamonas rubra]SFM17410.1 Tetratricopeptide repeat-containing protein [Rugamonas rubra]
MLQQTVGRMAGRMMAVMLALCCVAGAARAAAAPQIMTTIGGERPLRLQNLDIDGSVSGGMALTRVRMVFFNPNQRALEGRLQFPLLPGQRITAFALDVEGQLRPAVPVEKAKGRQIVEQLERRRVDPALLEQTQGNNFQLRVYPIAAQGTRTVELTYAEPLEREGANWAYRLPLAYGEVARGLNLRLQLNGADAAPQASGTLAELAFARRAGGYEAQIVKEHVSLDGTLKLLLPASAAPRSFVQQFDGATYFMAEVPLPPLPPAASRGARVLPKVVGLLWDSSGSGANRANAAELVELERYFKALGNGEVRLRWDRSYPKDFFYQPPPKGGVANEPSDGMPPPPPPRPLAHPVPMPAPIMAPSWQREKVIVAGSRVAQGDLAYGALAPAGPAGPAAESAVVAATNVLQRAESKSSTPGTGEIGVSLQKWRADAPYIARLQAAGTDRLYAIYLDERPSYTNSSAFFLDVADLLFERGQRELALRVLSNLAEMDLENRQVLRILGYRLMQAGAPELAIGVFEKVRELAEEEPQSFRDLGLAHAAADHPQQAVDQLYEVVLRPWDQRFAEIELIALAEMNAIVANAPRKAALDTSRIDPRLLKNMPLDLRAVLSWDADNSDMDLWVTDPNGERCFYGKRFSYQGGRMSLDFTGGYGPEEFSLRHAKPGKYRIEANFYGSTQQLVAAATTLQLRLSSGFGSGAAQDKLITLRLKGRGETVLVGEFEVKPK